MGLGKKKLFRNKEKCVKGTEKKLLEQKRKKKKSYI